MDQKRRTQIHRINYLTSEMESFYHQASLKLGVSDSVSMVLYTIYDTGESCLLSDIYKKTGISKQTINSAIRTLEASDHSVSCSVHRTSQKSHSDSEGERLYSKNSCQNLSG